MGNLDNITDDEKKKVITITNPTWRLLENQYISTTIDIKNHDIYTVYIHRLLTGCQKEDNKTVDHINGNKFDNRKANLRISSMSVQNQNRDLVQFFSVRIESFKTILKSSTRNQLRIYFTSKFQSHLSRKSTATGASVLVMSYTSKRD